ncbi:MAG TPA: hypothetical protein VG777_05305 [Thermoanaerobaculia bacterium]|nr:hypothetical protein [Thermoanaerobaculia bacterium]
MRRFVLLWAVLAAVGWVAGTAVDFAGFRRLDWTFDAFCAALFVPAAQSAAVCLLVPGRGVPLRSAWRTLSKPLAIRLLLAIDAALVAAGFLARSSSSWSAENPRGAPALAIAAQAAAAGVATLWLARRDGKPAERGALAAAGVAALVAAAAAAGFGGRAAALLLPRAPQLVRLIVFGVGGFVVGIGLLLAAVPIVARRRGEAARGLEAATGLALAAGAVAAAHLFRFPHVVPPWDGIIRALLVAAAALALASMAAALRRERPAR